jgi:uncharacterized protein
MHEGLNIVHPARLPPEPWANGGGVTRTLLAWPDPRHWWLRISVADVAQAGPFSVFPGVDRWFAVLAGDGVRLRTQGQPPIELRTGQASMHVFRGDDATECELLGGPTRDLNLMLRRRMAQAIVRELRDGTLRSDAELLGCFTCEPGALAVGADTQLELTGHTLAWIANPDRGPLECRFTGAVPRGWWFESSRGPVDDED